MKKVPFVISIVLNIALIATLLFVTRSSRRTAFRAVADATTAEVRLQEHILSELNSGDDTRIEKIKETLKRNISNGKKATADWKRSVNW